MGNQQEQKQRNGQIKITINHPKFQNSKLITEGGERLIQLTMGVDEKEYEHWKKLFISKKINSSFLLLPKKQDFSKKGLCGDSGSLKLTYENYSYLLKQEIQNRHGRQAKFEEWQLWFLLLGLVSAQQQMKTKMASKVGDIRPLNVFLNADGDIKLVNVCSWPRESTNFSKTFDNEVTYLSPEEIERLEMGKLDDPDSISSEVFSIGLTVLSAAMLQDFTRLYDIKNYRFNSTQATNILNEWKANQVYSEIFTALVTTLCQFQSLKRLDDKELWSWISKYEDQIRQKQDFVFEEAPLKVQQQIAAMRGQIQSVYLPSTVVRPVSHTPPIYVERSIIKSNPPSDVRYIPIQQQLLPNTQYVQYQQYGQGSPTRLTTKPIQIKRDVVESSYLPPGSGRVIGSANFSPQYVDRNVGELPAKLIGRTQAGEIQLPPQFVGRTINETYLPPSSSGYSHKGIPSNAVQVGEIKRRSIHVPQSNTNYYQNQVPNNGNKVERPESGQQNQYGEEQNDS